MNPARHTWYAQSKEGMTLHVHVQPGASRNRVSGLHGERLKLQIQAPPSEGKANKTLIAFIAELFGIPKSAVSITRGMTSREKTLFLEGISEEDLHRIIHV